MLENICTSPLNREGTGKHEVKGPIRWSGRRQHRLAVQFCIAEVSGQTSNTAPPSMGTRTADQCVRDRNHKLVTGDETHRLHRQLSLPQSGHWAATGSARQFQHQL